MSNSQIAAFFLNEDAAFYGEAVPQLPRGNRDSGVSVLVKSSHFGSMGRLYIAYIYHTDEAFM